MVIGIAISIFTFNQQHKVRSLHTGGLSCLGVEFDLTGLFKASRNWLVSIEAATNK